MGAERGPLTECAFVGVGVNEFECTKHFGKHKCGPRFCDRKTKDAAGTWSCPISGLIFSYGQCLDDGTANDGVRYGAKRDKDQPRVENVARVTAAAQRALANAEETARNVAELVLPDYALLKNGAGATPREHIDAYVHEIVRVWRATEGRVRAPTPAHHAIGCLMLMGKGMCTADGLADLLVDKCIVTPQLDGLLLSTADATKGKNTVRRSMQTDVRFRNHGDVLKELREARDAHAREIREGKFLTLGGPPPLPASAWPCRELFVPYRSMT